jgi:peptide deformylase
MIEVIPNEQTPRVDDIKDIKIFLSHNAKELQEFKNYIYTRFDAVGLACNQVSFNNYRFMARAFALREVNNNDIPQANWRLIIDPIITEHIGIKELKLEGCLTWKGMYILAQRSRAVRVDYYDEVGEKKIGEVYKGFEAQIWQHEINHLNGVEELVVSRTFSLPKPVEVGRNDQCPCGSGKKYKQCCLLLL